MSHNPISLLLGTYSTDTNSTSRNRYKYIHTALLVKKWEQSKRPSTDFINCSKHIQSNITEQWKWTTVTGINTDASQKHYVEQK